MNWERSLEILQLKPGATPAEIRQAYLDLVQVWHPDRFVGNERMNRIAEEKLRELNAAYQTLESPFPLPNIAQNVYETPVITENPPAESPGTTSYPWHLLRLGSLRQQWLLVVAAAALLGLGGWIGNRIFDSFRGFGAASTPKQSNAEGEAAANATGGSREARENASAFSNPSSASSALMDGSVPVPQGSVPGETGEIDVRNDTDSEATLAILSTRSPKQVLSRAPLPAGGSVVLRGLIPDSYWVDVSVTGYGQSPFRLGPFAIVRTTGEKGVSADRYEVHLRPQTKP